MEKSYFDTEDILNNIRELVAKKYSDRKAISGPEIVFDYTYSWDKMFVLAKAINKFTHVHDIILVAYIINIYRNKSGNSRMIDKWSTEKVEELAKFENIPNGDISLV